MAINKVILIGNLGNDPEIRYTQNQKQVATLSIATSDRWTDRQTGQRQERTEWHRVILFERLAEIAGQYLQKGSKVYIEGRLQTRKWQNQQGQDQYTTEIIVNDLQMLDSRQQQSPAPANNAYAQAASPPAAQPYNKMAAQPLQQQAAIPQAIQNFNNFDDAIPF